MLPDALHCTGCGVCQSVCPVSAIKMKENAEGFAYPEIDAAVCVHCGLCEKKCHLMSEASRNAPLTAYAAQYTRTGLKDSASGGAFMALAEWMLSQGGAVAGCAYDKNLNPKHILIREAGELPLLQGSKYVESDLGDVFSQVEAALRQGTPVLFTGTGCQIAALKKYLGNETDSLWCAEILCHGVPSRRLFADYLRFLGRRSPVRSFVFRSKESSYGDYCFRYQLENGRAVSGCREDDFYYHHFYAASDYRESCYRCAYAGMRRIGDFTLGDLWGAEILCPDFPTHAGASLVLANTDRAEELLKSGALSCRLQPVDAGKAATFQSNLRGPTKRPEKRDRFYHDLRKRGIPMTVFLWKSKKRGKHLRDSVLKRNGKE